MTVTIEGSLHAFDASAFKASLASRLDMATAQFELRRVSRRGTSALSLQSRSSHLSVIVDIDEEGYLRHEASVSGGSVSTHGLEAETSATC